jgi:uncharacterized membrane protein
MTGLEATLARLLSRGTWLASAVTGAGLVFGFSTGHRDLRMVTAGIALFILLPVLRVAVMLVAFLRQRDYRFGAFAAFVLIVIALGFVAGSVARV